MGKKCRRKNVLNTNNTKQKSEGANTKGEGTKHDIETKINSTNSENALTAIFRSDELQELEKIMKVKDLSTVSHMLGAVILGKFDVVKKLLKQGHDVNERGVEQSSALMWAVRARHLEMVEMLVSRGADVAAVDSRGDSALLLALHGKPWHQDAAMDFWRTLQKTHAVDVNHANHAGNTALHYAVKRQWPLLVETLLEHQARVNVENGKGVTPLTMAAARCDPHLVELLLRAGADPLHEDQRGCTPLCYALANTVQKSLPPPHRALERLTQDFHPGAPHRSYEHYLHRRLQLLVDPPPGLEDSYHSVVSKVTVPALGWLVAHEPVVLQVLLGLRVFERVCEIVERHLGVLDRVGAALAVAAALLGAPCNTTETETTLSEAFIASGGLDLCLEVLRRHRPPPPASLLALALALASPSAHPWLQNNHSHLQPFYTAPFLDVCITNCTQRFDESQIHHVKEKLHMFKQFFEELCVVVSNPPVETSTYPRNAKRSRRKANKALKARIDKIRRADVVQRLHLCAPPGVEAAVEMACGEPVATSSVDSVHGGPHVEGEIQRESMESLPPDNSASSNQSEESGLWVAESASAERFPRTWCADLDDDEPRNTRARFEADVVQLRILLHDVIGRYSAAWHADARAGHPAFLGGHGDRTHPHLQGSREQQLQKLAPILPLLGQRFIQKLVDNFNKTITKIEKLFDANDNTYATLLAQVKTLLMEHQVRGETLLPPVLPADNDEPFEEEAERSQNFGPVGEHLSRSTYMQLIENVFPEKSRSRAGVEISPDELYLQEMALIAKCESNLTQEEVARIKKNTEDNAYHLVKSVFKVCESDTALAGHFKSTEPRKGRALATTSGAEQVVKSSRWESAVSRLRGLLERRAAGGGGGDEVASAEEYVTIASGGNFGDVELCLGAGGARPLALKRVRNQSAGVCRSLAAAVGPLRAVRHRHVLPYVACAAVAAAEVHLATPLCELNLGEYVLCLKQRRRPPGAAAPPEALARQLLAGLRHLHQRAQPIVHGNLKPSNVLIDLQGRLRLADFGIHQTLYQHAQAPKSSLIWFARETYERYERSAALHCSRASDVQVAGMLLHFALSRGLHPFGLVTEDILRNLVRGEPHLRTAGCELDDLISWMLVYEPEERPTAGQILSHVYFWDAARKWRFLLACAGLGEGRLPVERFHAELEARARRGRVRGDWLTVVRARFPDARLPATDDTPVGLLRFLRTCAVDGSQRDLQDFFLAAFPALPLSLYRLLEDTEWLEHAAFAHFTKYFPPHSAV